MARSVRITVSGGAEHSDSTRHMVLGELRSLVSMSPVDSDADIHLTCGNVLGVAEITLDAEAKAVVKKSAARRNRSKK